MEKAGNMPIGVFDSGLGGLTVAREIMRNLPNERIVYFGDTARVPYGSKSKNTIVRYSRQIVRFLKTQDIKAIVIACNTATSAAAATLRAEYGEDAFFDEKAPFRSVAQWDDWQQGELRRLAEAGDIRLSDEGAEIWRLGEEHETTLMGKGTVTLDKDGLRLGSLHFPLEGMQEPELCHLAGKETMMFTNEEGSFELRFRGSPSRRKYQLLIREFLALRQEKTAG